MLGKKGKDPKGFGKGQLASSGKGPLPTKGQQQTSNYAGGKVVVIYPADELNINGANALLKVLEEPTPNTYFLLVTGALYALPALVISPEGKEQYQYDFVWAEHQCTGLVHPDAPGVYLPGHEDEIRLNCIWFTYTLDVKGHAFLSIWKYDQRQIPLLYGYLPNFKRVRRFPANQRFEPYMAGMNLYLSDAHAAGDPYLTWGNYKIIYRGPFMGSTNDQWSPTTDNWIPSVVGGQKDQTYFYVGKSLIPEVIVFEGEPIGYPNAPVSKRRVYMDARNSSIIQSITYDRYGEVWKSFEGGAGQYKTESHEILTTDGRPEYSGHWLISHDVQTSMVTRIHLGQECRGDWKTALDPSEDVLNNYMTVQALRRLGT